MTVWRWPRMSARLEATDAFTDELNVTTDCPNLVSWTHAGVPVSCASRVSVPHLPVAIAYWWKPDARFMWQHPFHSTQKKPLLSEPYSKPVHPLSFEQADAHALCVDKS